jgi:hypothetical protein
MTEAKIKTTPRMVYVFCGLLLAVATGSMTGFTLDQAIAGNLWWLVVLWIVAYLFSKIYARLRLAMGLTKTLDPSRRISWFGDLEAWIFSLFMGSLTLVRELHRSRSAVLTAIFGVAGTLLMLAILVGTSRFLNPAKGKNSQVDTP